MKTKVLAKPQILKPRTTVHSECKIIFENDWNDPYEYIDRPKSINRRRTLSYLTLHSVVRRCQLNKAKHEDWVFSYHYDNDEIVLQKKFNELATQWKKETGGYSTVKQMVANENYKYIIAMGPQVLPFIFKDLMIEPNYWFEALRLITRIEKDPIPDKYYGNLNKMSRYWLEWGKQNKYIK